MPAKLLMLAFLRVDARELRAHFAEPGLVVLATAWIMLAVPAVLGLVLLALGLSDRGTLSFGLRADLALWDVDDPAELAYAIGANPCVGIIRGGNVVSWCV